MTDIIIFKTSEGGDDKSAFLISNLNNFSWDVNTPVSPMPLPEDSHESNILVKMEGNSAQINVSWTVTEGSYFGKFNTTTKVFTATGSLSTYEQIDEFKSNFIPTFIRDGYSIFIMDGTDVLLSDDGTIGSLRFDVSGQSPVVWNANLQFMVGDVVSLFEADVPDRPVTAYMSQPNTSVKQIKIEWTEFNQYANAGDKVTVTGVAVKYKFKNEPWQDFTESDLITSEQTGSGGDGLGSGASGSSAFTPTFRTFEVARTGNYKFQVGLLSEKSDDAAIILYENVVKSGTTNDKILTVV